MNFLKQENQRLAGHIQELQNLHSSSSLPLVTPKIDNSTRQAKAVNIIISSILINIIIIAVRII